MCMLFEAMELVESASETSTSPNSLHNPLRLLVAVESVETGFETPPSSPLTHKHYNPADAVRDAQGDCGVGGVNL